MIVIKSGALRKAIKITVPFVLAPAAVLLGVFAFGEKRYAFISLAVTLLALLLFLSGFEKKKTGTRRLIMVTVMVALSVAGRFIPFFKPVTALTVLCAIYFGSEAGFLCGALSAVISNFYFGQGPWTPFQMLAWGLIGLIAGFAAPALRRSRTLLIIYGVLAGIAFSFIMDIWTVLWYNSKLNVQLYVSALISAAPHTALYAISNALFLWLLAKPIGQKLERVKIKYGV